MDIQTRLKEFLAYKNLTYKDFELKTGLANAAASRIGENSRSNTFNRVAKAFPELNVEWLKVGVGEMLNSDIEDSPAQPADSAAPPTTLDKALDEIAAQRRMMEKSQEQIDRLLSIIERMNGAK